MATAAPALLLGGAEPRTKVLRRGEKFSKSSPGLGLGVPWSEVREAFLEQLPAGDCDAKPVDFASRKAVLAQLKAARKCMSTKLDGESAAVAAVGGTAADDTSDVTAVPLARSSSRTFGTLALLRKELDSSLEESLQGSVPWPSKLVRRPTPLSRVRPAPLAVAVEEPQRSPASGIGVSGSLELSAWSIDSVALQASRAATTMESGIGKLGRSSSTLQPLGGESEERRRSSLQEANQAAAAPAPMPKAIPTRAPTPKTADGKSKRHTLGRSAQLTQLPQYWKPLPGEGTRAPLSRSELGEVSWQDAFGDLPPQPKRELLPLDPKAARLLESRLDSKTAAASFPSLRALRTCAETPDTSTRGSTPRSQSSADCSLAHTAPLPTRARCDQLPPLPGGGGGGGSVGVEARAAEAGTDRDSSVGGGPAPRASRSSAGFMGHVTEEVSRPLHTLAQMCGVSGVTRRSSRSVPSSKASRSWRPAR